MDLTGIGSIADLAKGIMDRFIPAKATEGERAAVALELQRMLATRESAVLDVQKSVMVAELEQSDPYTKRARPTIVYSGLVSIHMVHVLFPMISWFTKDTLPNLQLPEAFWWSWTGVIGAYVVGRTYEKSTGNDPMSMLGNILKK